MSDLHGSVGILGGSFNPVHNGHVRMAVEVREALDLSRVDLVPAKVPPHKGTAGLLDFSLRLELLHLAVDGVQGIAVSGLEGELPVPSYSYSTLEYLRRTQPGVNHVFIMGGGDFLTLPDWHRGLELPLLADIVVVRREDVALEAIDRFLDRYWQWSCEGHGVRRVSGGRRIFFLSIPRLDISSSLVRDRFLACREVAGLVSEGERAALVRHGELCRRVWRTIRAGASSE